MRTHYAIATLILFGASLALTPATASPEADGPSSARPAASAAASSMGPSRFNQKAEGIDNTRAATFKPRNASREEIEAAIVRYWTPENIRKAIRNGPPPSASKKSKGATRSSDIDLSDLVQGFHGRRSSVEPAMGASLARPYNKNKTIGKFLFNLPSGAPSSCSAAATNSGSKRLVTTAGHCVHVGDGMNDHWMTNGVFIPAYRNGNTPFGTFPVRWLRTFDWWRKYGDDINDPRGNLRDVAYASLANGRSAPKKKIVNAVGGQGSIFTKGGKWEWKARVVGYPKNKKNGERVSVCTKRTSQADVGPYERQQVGCKFESGSSGGPWLWKADTTTGLGRIRSVTSLGDVPVSYIVGPPFDAGVKGMWTCANRDWPDGAGHCDGPVAPLQPTTAVTRPR